MRTIDADICVIGAGSGGLSVAAGAAQLGRRVVLCESGEMGGDCLNYGCVPSKALLAAAATRGAVDYAAAMDRVRAAIGAIAPHDSQQRFENLGCTVIRAHATFVGPREAQAADALIRARHFVIATGASPAVPSIEGLDQAPHFTNETIFANRALPDHLLIIGAGPVGLELGQAHRRLGARVTIIEAAQALRGEDRDAAAVVTTSLAREGIDIRENARIRRIRAAAGVVSVETEQETIAGSHLLVAAGRRPNVERLGLDRAGVAFDDRGVRVNARLQTSNPRIYAIGDVAGGGFTHVAGDHASTIVRNVIFKTPAKRRDALAPRAVYTDPELASIGVTAEGAGATSLRWDFADNDRAVTEDDRRGFAKIFVGRRGRIAGAVVVGRGAGELIAPVALAMANGLGISAFTRLIAPYPTRSEVWKRAAGKWYSPTLFSSRTRALVRLLATFD